MSGLYRLFDQVIDSALPLPGPLRLEAEQPDWRVLLPGAGIPEAFEPFHRWQAPDGTEIMAAGRQDKRYQLEFTGLARFYIDFDGRCIAAYPLAECPEHTLAHLLLDQVVPRALCHQGRMVVHASAVELPGGKAVAFTGPSGFGKSTLAAAFHRAGCTALTDDCLLLEEQGGVVRAVASYPSLRLWPDSSEEWASRDNPAALQAAPMAHYTNKQQFFLAGGAGQGGELRWADLAALYILDDPATTETGRPVVEEAGGMARIMAVIDALFALDVVDREAVQRQFRSVGRVTEKIPLYRLGYTRRFDSLPQVIQAVIEHGEGAC